METSSWPMVDHSGGLKNFLKNFVMETSSWPMVDHFGKFKNFF